MKKMLRALIFAALICLTLCGCSSGPLYDNADRYTAGETEIREDIRALDIHWICGSVTVEYHEGDTVILSERAKKSLPEEDVLRWWLDGTTLRVQFSAPMLQRWTPHPEKELIVSLPAGLVLENADITTISGKLQCDGLAAERAVLSATSGDIYASCTASDLSIHSTSGSITAVCDADNISVDLVSGVIDLTHTGAAESLTTQSTSGTIHLNIDEVEQVDIHPVSGGVTMECAVLPEALTVYTVSGGVALYVPGDAGFTAEVKTTSGRFNSDLLMKTDGSRYFCGDGKCSVNIHTVSADISIYEK